MILISIGGTTSSGKSQLARIALNYLVKKNLKVKIINCDSRQIYKGLTVSSGVDIQADAGVSLIGKFNLENRVSVVDYLKKFIREIVTEKPFLDVVILVGGTGMYSKAITDKYKLTETRPEFQKDFDKLEIKLESQSKEQLQNLLQEIDLGAFNLLNNSDKNNPRRLKNSILRITGYKKSWYSYLEVPEFTKTVKFWTQINETSKCIKIEENLENRIKNSMVEEIMSLIQSYGTDRVKELGLGYRYGVDLFNKNINFQEWRDLTLKSEIQYAKRQVTWLKNQNGYIIDSPETFLFYIDTIL